MRSLSKSNLMAFRQCTKRLWLHVHRPELQVEEGAAESHISHGLEVGELARSLYDDSGRGVTLEPAVMGVDAALAQTQAALAARVPIFEAALSAEGALVFADVLLPVVKNGRPQWRLIEVKAATRIKGYYRDDLAIQAYVAERAGVALASIELAHIDKSFVYGGDGDYRGLLKEVDLTEEIQARRHEVRDWLKQSQRLIATDCEPTVDVGRQCRDPHPCDFYDHCSHDRVQAEYPIDWLPGAQSRILRSVLESGANDMRDLPDELLNGTQLRIKQATVSGTPYFDIAGAAADLARYPLPAYFLDFESIQFAVPRWRGTSPYQQICFQFSLHRVAGNGEVEHREFLDVSGADPSAAFAHALIEACGEQGAIFVYHINFERTRVKELAQRFPEMRDPLLALAVRMVDLLPIAKTRYYHPSQRGSWSIKKVLPAVAPDLRYDELEGVQSGTMAMDAYLEATRETTDEQRRRELREQLLRYCELDTWAMVRIWHYFSGQALELAVASPADATA